MATLFHLLPPTIHPMVIHFTIAIIYLCTLAGLVGFVWRREGLFYAKAFYILLALSIVATLAAGVAGVVSESYVSVNATTGSMLEVHKRNGELTGVLLVFAAGFQWLKWRKVKGVSAVALVICIAATILVSITGEIGGALVYDHGLGVH